MDEHVSAQCLIGKCGACPACEHHCHVRAGGVPAGESENRAAELASTAVTIGVAVVVGLVVLAVALPVSLLSGLVLRRRPDSVVLLWDEA